MDAIWKKLSDQMNLDSTASQIWLEKLKERYNDTTRHYHTESEMLKSKLPHLNDQKAAVVLAALFQYYTYDSKSNSTEANCSAFSQFCKDTALNDESLVQHTLKLLGDPATHFDDTLDDDINFLQDLDLIYLGACPDIFKSQTALLRQEYAHMNDKQYSGMRLKFLETFLNVLPCIYSTTKFRDLYEETAKANITAEIEELRASV